MAFLEQAWGKVSTTLNQPIVTLDSGVVIGTPTFYTYQSATDAIATIVTVDYFAAKAFELSVGDVIYVMATDATQFVSVTALTIDPNSVTVSDLSPAGVVGTANIQALAVTTAKLANNAVTSAKLATDLVQFVAVPMTAAQIAAMYGAPYLLVAAAGANTQLVVHRAELVLTFVSAQYTSGGVIGIQLDSTVHGAGIIMSDTLAAATFNAYAASASVGLDGASTSGALTAKVNKGLYLSNTVGAFATGDSTLVVNLWYSTVPTA